jgi:hypothetical protein
VISTKRTGTLWLLEVDLHWSPLGHFLCNDLRAKLGAGLANASGKAAVKWVPRASFDVAE